MDLGVTGKRGRRHLAEVVSQGWGSKQKSRESFVELAAGKAESILE